VPEVKLPPHDIDAEEAVIGSLLIDGTAIHKVALFLQQADFYSEKNREIYGACVALYQREDAINQIQDPELILGKITIDDKDIKISSDNSKEAKIQYLETTGKIILNNSNEFYVDPTKALEQISSGANVSGVNQLADTYLEIFKKFLNTNVPSDWLGLHKRYLIIAKKFELAYRGMADFQNDPVKTYLLGEMLPGLIEIENQIKGDYANKEKELGI